MLIKVKVFPESAENKVVQKSVDFYEVYVRARAEHNHANILTAHLLGEHLGRRLKMVSGATRQNKIFKAF